MDTSHEFGRRFDARVTGDSAHDLELAALDQAAEFFGHGVQLHIDETYIVHRAYLPSDEHTYRALITVRELRAPSRT